MTRPISRLMVIVIGVALVAASCGDDADVLPTTGPQSQTVAEFMGWADFDQAAADQAYEDLTGRMGDMTVACMAEHGLEYTPWTPPEPLDPEDLPPAEARLRYGYGVFALMIEQYRYETEHADEIGNPNEAIHAQNAPEGVDYMTLMWECEDAAEAALKGSDSGLALRIDEAWTPLNDEHDAMFEELQGDPRLATAEDDWSACMAGKGYAFATEAELEARLAEMFDEFDELGGTPALWEGVLTVADVQPYADEEMAIARADAACRGDLDEVRADVERAYEARFVDKHREELEKIRPLEQELMDELLTGVRW